MRRFFYDRLGQLKKKNVGGSAAQTALQNVDYSYNIRGWLKAINDVNNLGTIDLFAFKLGYNEGTTPLYNGNISLTQWKTRNTDSSLKTYNYTYDALNRILTATDNTTKFNLTGLSYDKNGNIMGLIRQGQVVETPSLAAGTGYGTMDNLVYAYDSGNKLLKVTDNANDTYGFKDGINTGDDFSYDTNGNMLTDANKGITNILYNHLNLPVTVTFSGTNKKIDYFYDAVGTKLKKVVTDASSLISTEYAGNYVYESGVLQFFNTAEGYVEPVSAGSTTFVYVFQYKDHPSASLRAGLGNIRLSYADADGNGIIAQTEIREENNYYPFGLKHKGYNNAVGGSRDHKYGFGNKEEQDELGLGWIDITARNYDPTLGRWMNLDPLAELMRRHSPYNYAFDNPVYFIDADGMMPKPPDPPVKKIKESSQAGNINPVGVNSRGFFPSSTSSSVGVSVEVSIKQDDFGILSLVSPELTYSVSSEIKTVTSQFLDADGNSVSNIEDATSFAVTTNTKTTTIDVGFLGEISEQATVTETNVSTTYDITKSSEGKLSNPVETQNETKISTIDSKTSSSTLQNLAKDEANQNLSKISSTFSNGVKESVNSTEQHNQKVLKKL